jgi:hypothetical protein
MNARCAAKRLRTAARQAAMAKKEPQQSGNDNRESGALILDGGAQIDRENGSDAGAKNIRLSNCAMHMRRHFAKPRYELQWRAKYNRHRHEEMAVIPQLLVEQGRPKPVGLQESVVNRPEQVVEAQAGDETKPDMQPDV